MARQESLLRASSESAELKPALPGLLRHEFLELHPDSHTTDTSRLGACEAADLPDGLAALRPETLIWRAVINWRRRIPPGFRRASVSRCGAALPLERYSATMPSEARGWMGNCVSIWMMSTRSWCT
jgi:hypothetical protein